MGGAGLLRGEDGREDGLAGKEGGEGGDAKARARRMRARTEVHTHALRERAVHAPLPCSENWALAEGERNEEAWREGGGTRGGGDAKSEERKLGLKEGGFPAAFPSWTLPPTQTSRVLVLDLEALCAPVTKMEPVRVGAVEETVLALVLLLKGGVACAAFCKTVPARGTRRRKLKGHWSARTQSRKLGGEEYKEYVPCQWWYCAAVACAPSLPNELGRGGRSRELGGEEYKTQQHTAFTVTLRCWGARSELRE
ncbi:hypothetical protein DFH09DRAFT_1365067 [Mycena vulgaris]|nr:hypothetical protein DFH09DRAFT_1365067 [Mycena vulgaris]